MTLVGKMLTVLILIMSVSFMMIAVTVFSTHRSWRDEALDHKGKIETLRQTNSQLEDELSRADDSLAVEQAARRYALAALQVRLEQLETSLRQREEQVRGYLTTNSDLAQKLETNTLNLDELRKQVVKLREDILAAQQARDETFNSVVALTEQLHGAQGNLSTLSEQEKQLRDQVSRMKVVMDVNDLTVDTPVAHIPPRVDGVVTAVGRKDLIEISIGSDDGLKLGHALEVYRNNAYLGRVVVHRIDRDRCVCQIVPQYRKGNIKKGDRVATRLS